jgi:hypothetical protein
VKAPAKCGTDSGYKAHRGRDEDACRPCKDAHNAANTRDPEARAAYHGAYQRALRRLAKLHRGRFAALLAEERAKAVKT